MSSTVRNDFPGWVGFKFTVGSSPILVSELGRWVRSGNSGSHPVKLVNADGTDVPGAMGTVNTSGATVGAFAYAALANPVVLEAGRTYCLVSREDSQGDTWHDFDGSLTPASGITIHAGVWFGDGSPPTEAGGSNNGYVPVNLKFASGAWALRSETRFVYDGNVILQERDQSNTPKVTLTRGLDLSGSLQGAGGIGGLLALTENALLTSGSPQLAHVFCHSDGNGNVTALMDWNQKLVGRYIYDPFGNTILASGPRAALNRYRFSSKPEHESGMYDFWLRWYAPELQRWLNQDPIGEVGGLNLYGFVYNNPVTLIDAWGLDVFICSRDVKLSGGGGAHTWIEVIDSNGNKTTYSGIYDSGKLGVRKNYPDDCNPTKKNPKTSTCPIPPPSGMTQQQWDNAVKQSGEKEIKKDKKREYRLGGGDGGNKSGNCHCVSRQIIEGAGGKIPPSYDPPGLQPGLR